MLQKTRDAVPCAAALAQGLHRWAESAAAAYGGGRMLGLDAKGNAVCTEKMGEFLTCARASDPSTEAVRALLAQKPLEDGMKTAVLLADALRRRMEAQATAPDGLDKVQAYCMDHLRKLARNCGDVLPGGGLYLLNLARPLRRLGETIPAAQAAAEAMDTPLRALAEAAGFAGYEVYERVRSASPNQFYSLQHFGLTGSINGTSEFYDVIRFGFDNRAGRIVDLPDAGITVPLETGCETVAAAIGMVETMYRVKSVLT